MLVILCYKLSPEPDNAAVSGLPKDASRYLGRGYQLYCTVM
ncbi:hypothetical protein ACLBR5_05430 [Escherichia coli]